MDGFCLRDWKYFGNNRDDGTLSEYNLYHSLISLMIKITNIVHILLQNILRIIIKNLLLFYLWYEDETIWGNSIWLARGSSHHGKPPALQAVALEAACLRSVHLKKIRNAESDVSSNGIREWRQACVRKNSGTISWNVELLAGKNSNYRVDRQEHQK